MTQKEVALQIMRNMIQYKPIIRAYEKQDRVMFSEGPLGASYDVDGEPALMEAIERVESEYGCKVFHATHTFTEFGECFELLVVSQYKEEWARAIEDSKDGICFCWVENLTDPWCSEFGDVAFKPSVAGDIKRSM